MGSCSPIRSMRMVGSIRGVTLAGLLVASSLSAQVPSAPPAVDSMAMRRTAIMSVLVSRERREGSAIEVEMCSLLDAMGYGALMRRAAPPTIAASLVDGYSAGCFRRGGGRGVEPWVPIAEVAQIRIERQQRGPEAIGPIVTMATVQLSIWPSALSRDREVYEFVATSDTTWAHVSFKRSRDLRIDGHFRRERENPLVLVNGTVAGVVGTDELFTRLRGDVIDSVRFLPRDSSVAKYGSAARGGAIIIGTHPVVRRP